MTRVLAPRLRPGDVIGVPSPSAPMAAFAPGQAAHGIALLERAGFRVKPGKLFGKLEDYRAAPPEERADYRAAPPEARADELNALFRDPDVRCVLPVAGGDITNAVLPMLDYGALARDPKLIVGYSDVTALLNAVLARTGLVSFWGPMLVSTLGQKCGAGALDSFLALNAAKPPYTLPTPPFFTEDTVAFDEPIEPALRPNALHTVRGGVAEGTLWGGNLNTLMGIFGTPYLPPCEPGSVLFLEDQHKTAETLEKQYGLLRCAGVFERAGGLLLGKHCDRPDGCDPPALLCEAMGGRSVPFLADFDLAHTRPTLSAPLGVRVRLDADAQTLTLIEPWLE